MSSSADRIGAGVGQKEQVAAQGRPARFPGQSVEQQVATLVQAGNQLRVGDVFGSEVEGVQLAGGGAEPDGGILVEDGDPHAAIWSDTLRPWTATELREQVLARDATTQSATTLRRDEQVAAVLMRRRLSRPCDPPCGLLTEQVWLMINRADRRAGGLSASAIPKLRPNSATPLRCTSRRVSPPTPGMASSPARSQGSSCPPC